MNNPMNNTQPPVLPLDDRIAAATASVTDGEVSLGAALREAFPEAHSGDESPEMAAGLYRAVETYVRAWAAANVEAPSFRAAFIGDEQIGESYPWSSDVTEGDIHDCAWAVLIKAGRNDEWPKLEVRFVPPATPASEAASPSPAD